MRKRRSASPRRSAVERVAREILLVAAAAPSDSWPDRARAIAAWHLREVRRARGKTVGYTTVEDGDAHLCCAWVHNTAGAREFASKGGYRVARVVLLPRRRRGKR